MQNKKSWEYRYIDWLAKMPFIEITVIILVIPIFLNWWFFGEWRD